MASSYDKLIPYNDILQVCLETDVENDTTIHIDHATFTIALVGCGGGLAFGFCMREHPEHYLVCIDPELDTYTRRKYLLHEIVECLLMFRHNKTQPRAHKYATKLELRAAYTFRKYNGSIRQDKAVRKSRRTE
jgi:hypothetical protein